MEEIKAYLSNEKKLDPVSIVMLMAKYEKHSDILNEFAEVIKTGIYPEEGVNSGDWTAKRLAEELPHLENYTVYEFMAGLRDNPESYAKYIAEGAPYL